MFIDESQWPQIAEVWYHLNRQSAQDQHPCCPQSQDLVLLPFGFSFHSSGFLLRLEYLNQLRLFFVLLEVVSPFYSGSQHLELHCAA